MYNHQIAPNFTLRQGCKQDLRVRDRDIWFSVRDETETLLGRDRELFRDALPCAIMANYFLMLYEFMVVGCRGSRVSNLDQSHEFHPRVVLK